MQSDPKQCLYCTNNQTLHDLMIEICELSVSRACKVIPSSAYTALIIRHYMT